MKFVCGIHGAGKNAFCKRLHCKTGLLHFSASQIINNRLGLNQKNTKNIDYIDERQEILLHEVKLLKQHHGDFILDGHLCLINMEGNIEPIPNHVFSDLGITDFFIIMSDPETIRMRLQKRDNIFWDIEFIEQFQSTEYERAKELAKGLDIDLHIIDECSESKNNILLPIKPVYVDRILNGSKRYEYRKHLCTKEINKIYLYATSPVKAILGEVEVLSKIKMEVDELWKQTADFSGINRESYINYFHNVQLAGAYQLGQVIKYKTGILLSEIGMSYAPQSYVYIGEI